jgi:uncharacterized protein YndB with AHSA1/START domain
MTVTSVEKDPEALTMTIVSEFDAPIQRVWQLWDDPRQLERWWGPPTYPATVVEHDLTPGGAVTYYMTGPDGDQPHGWWRVLAVDPPRRLEFEDGFADDAGVPNPDLPVTTGRVTLSEQPGGGTRMVIETTFPSVEAMEQILAMGMEEGITAALGQCDDILRADVTSM